MDEPVDFLFRQCEHYHLVDALPYIDPTSAEMQTEVKRLIGEEMRAMEKTDRLALLPLPKTPIMDKLSGKFTGCESANEIDAEAEKPIEDEQSEAPKDVEEEEEGHNDDVPLDILILKNELNRMSEGKPMERLDMSRYEVKAPTGHKAKDPKEWASANQRASSQIEYNILRMSNVELSVKYAQRSWLKHLADLEVHCESYKRHVAHIKASVEAVNKGRKLDQISCGNDLRSLTREWEDYVQRNAEISRVIGTMTDSDSSGLVPSVK